MAGNDDFKARYNALQAKHQEALRRLRALEGAQGAGQGPTEYAAPVEPARRRDASRTGEEPASTPDDSGPSLTDLENESIRETIRETKLARAREQAAEKYPQAAGLFDMIAADDADAFMSTAAQIAEALGGANSEPAPPPPPPVTSGAPPILPPSPDDELQQAKDEARATGNWSKYFRIKDRAARGG
jgi:hypothetical protein